jgi:HSP20 family molecular chaperone IbpA
VYEVDSQVTVKIEIAGMDADNVVVRLDGRQLTVRGCRYDPADKLAYQQMEISYGEFRSDVYLPSAVDESQARAYYVDGFLYIHLPKAQLERHFPVVVVVRSQ